MKYNKIPEFNKLYSNNNIKNNQQAPIKQSLILS